MSPGASGSIESISAAADRLIALFGHYFLETREGAVGDAAARVKTLYDLVLYRPEYGNELEGRGHVRLPVRQCERSRVLIGQPVGAIRRIVLDYIARDHRAQPFADVSLV